MNIPAKGQILMNMKAKPIVKSKEEENQSDGSSSEELDIDYAASSVEITKFAMGDAPSSKKGFTPLVPMMSSIKLASQPKIKINIPMPKNPRKVDSTCIVFKSSENLGALIQKMEQSGKIEVPKVQDRSVKNTHISNITAMFDKKI